MKKLFLPLIMGLATLGASAQAGDVAFGVNLGVAPVLEDGASVTNIGLGAKVQLGTRYVSKLPPTTGSRTTIFRSLI
jgi:hypothetical protein